MFEGDPPTDPHNSMAPDESALSAGPTDAETDAGPTDPHDSLVGSADAGSGE